jgi:hypothetical protein
MRFLLYTSKPTDDFRAAAALVELSGHVVTTNLHLADADHPMNDGVPVSPAAVNQNIVLELISGAALAVHEDTTEAAQQELAALCRFLCVPMIRMEDIRLLADMNEEQVDSLNLAYALHLHKAATTSVIAPSPYMAERPPYVSIEQPRTLREKLRALLERCHRWGARFNATPFARAPKNPVSRELLEARSPRTYRLHTNKPMTTG